MCHFSAASQPTPLGGSPALCRKAVDRGGEFLVPLNLWLHRVPDTGLCNLAEAIVSECSREHRAARPAWPRGHLPSSFLPPTLTASRCRRLRTCPRGTGQLRTGRGSSLTPGPGSLARGVPGNAKREHLRCFPLVRVDPAASHGEGRGRGRVSAGEWRDRPRPPAPRKGLGRRRLAGRDRESPAPTRAPNPSFCLQSKELEPRILAPSPVSVLPSQKLLLHSLAVCSQ